MGTLPRTKSLSAADTVSLGGGRNKDRIRPTSFCESTFLGRINSKSPQVRNSPSHKIHRVPSQANCLSTTVPQSLVNMKLGGRHTPTRGSLRHSRMVVRAHKARIAVNNSNGSASATYPKGDSSVHGQTKKAWRNLSPFFPHSGVVGGLGRAGALVLVAQAVTGAMGCGLGACLWLWAPSLPPTVMTQYAALPVFVSSLVGGLFVSCGASRRRWCLPYTLKFLCAFVSICGVVLCACVCVFSAVHLAYLAPMKCTPLHHITHTSPSLKGELSPKEGGKGVATLRKGEEGVVERSIFDEVEGIREVWGDEYRDGVGKTVVWDNMEKREKGDEGSGFQPDDDEDDAQHTPIDQSPLDDNHISPFSRGGPFIPNGGDHLQESQVEINSTSCVCERLSIGEEEIGDRDESNTILTWFRPPHALHYPDLTCSEVKNVLPVLFVASCVLTSVGAVLCLVLLYLLWAHAGIRPRGTASRTPRGALRPPFVFRSTVKRGGDGTRREGDREVNGGIPLLNNCKDNVGER